jgi:Holliday junction resolvase RusA-like endonuclease
VIRVEVLGEPRPKGSLKAIPRPGGKGVWMKESAGEGLRTWREQLSAAFQAAAEGLDEPLAGPVAVFCHFRLSPPKTRRFAWPIAKNRNDLDKLERGVLDHLSGVILVDDAQVVLLVATKVYGRPGATVVIEEVSHGNGTRVDLGTLTLEASNALLGGEAEAISTR